MQHPSAKSTDDETARHYEAKRTISQEQTRLTETQIDEVIERYRTGAPLRDLAIEYGCNRNTLSARLKKRGLEPRWRQVTEQDIDEAVRLYESGMSLVRVGERIGISGSAVRNYLLARGVPARDSHVRTK